LKQFQVENKEIKRKLDALEKENQDKELQVSDLLRECQRYKLQLNYSDLSTSQVAANEDLMEDQEEEEFNPNESVHKSLDAISFSDIGELQTQLRKTARKLREAEAKHKQEIEELQEVAKEGSKKEVAVLDKKLETLRADSQRLQGQFTLIMKERDFYKQLAKENERRLKDTGASQIVDITYVVFETIVSLIFSVSRAQQDEERLKILKEEFTYERENLSARYYEARTELAKTTENLAVTRRDVQHWQDRYKTLESMMNNAQNDIGALRKLFYSK
jgi:chromosome segregation ATPase